MGHQPVASATPATSAMAPTRWGAGGVSPLLKPLGPHRREDRLAGDPHVEPDEVALGVERTAQLRLGDRVMDPWA
jgi:hypothetical protein